MTTKQLIALLTIFVLVLSAVTTVRTLTLEDDFHAHAKKMEQQSGTYDRDLIAMVNRLETELAERASFPYLGGKDPMTGKVRTVVAAPRPTKVARNNHRKQPAPEAVKTEPTTVAPTPQPVAPPEPVVELPKPDPVRLTAIIYDDFKKAYTAIMMVGERSYSVEVGDKVHGRLTRQINGSHVILEDEKKTYQYDISGAISNRVK